MVPQIENSIDGLITLVSYPNKTYKLSETQIAGKVDDLEAIKQAIHHILSIERYAYLIYDDNYGVELEKYIGQDFSYLEATIEDTLKEALTQDDRIVDVVVTNIYQTTKEQSMVDKTKLYKKIQSEDEKDIITEQYANNLITDKTKKWVTSSITEINVTVVEFDVYCKQGIIHTEVEINV